jgi:hypothetical protein
MFQKPPALFCAFDVKRMYLSVAIVLPFKCQFALAVEKTTRTKT